MNILVLVIAVILAILIEYLLAKEFYNVANLKGYRNKKYLWLCFFFSIIGYLLVISLPIKNNEAKSNIDELPEI